MASKYNYLTATIKRATFIIVIQKCTQYLKKNQEY